MQSPSFSAPSSPSAADSGWPRPASHILGRVFEELAEGVFRRRFPFLSINIGVVIGEDGVLLIDSRESHEAAGELAAELGRLTSKPVRWIVNTHWHWDHVFGNAVFPEAAVWGHRACRSALLDHPEQHRKDARLWMPKERFGEIDRVEIVPPQQTFEAMASINVGGRKVEATHHGLGHTDGDILIHCGDVTFMGDLVEQGGPPKMGDSYPFDWPNTLAAARSTIRSVVVPGHGGLLTPAAVETRRELMELVAERLREVIVEGRPADEAVRNGPIPELEMRKALARARRETGS